MTRLVCCLCGAKSNDRKGKLATVFKFPTNEAVKEQWIKVCPEDRLHKKSVGICSAHFSANAFFKDPSLCRERLRIKHNAVPTLLLLDQLPADESVPCTSTMEGIPKSFTKNSPRVKQTGMRHVDVTLELHTKLRRLQGMIGKTSVQQVLTHITESFLSRPTGVEDPDCAAPGTKSSTPSKSGPVVEPALSMMAPGASTIKVEPAASVWDWTPSTIPTPGSGWMGTPDRDLDSIMEDEAMDKHMELDADQGDLQSSMSVPGPPADIEHWGTKSAVVSEPQLMTLAKSIPVKCSSCGVQCSPTIKRITISFLVTWACDRCHRTEKTWYSTEKDGQVSTIDTLWASAIVLSGNHEAKVNRLLAFANMGQLSHADFQRITSKVVAPVIQEAFTKTLETNRERAMSASLDGIVVSGDGQNDSPDYSAAYGTYTVMDNATGHILAQSTVCQQDVGLSSPKLETEGVKECLSQLAHLPVKEFVSDQHLGVRKAVREQAPGVHYSYDVWHVAKNIAKRLRQRASHPECKALTPWIKHVKNHFWWCCQAAEGSEEKFHKLWLMVNNHVVNVHVTESGRNWCHHAPLQEDAREAPWLEPDSPAHKALQDVVTCKETLDVVPFVVNFRHTGSMEAFHALSMVYTPKLVYFTPPMYITRKQIAVLDYTAHLDRDFARDEEGNQKSVRVFSRVSNAYVLRPVKVAKSNKHVRKLLQAIIQKQMETTITGPIEHGTCKDPICVFPYVHRAPGEGGPWAPGEGEDVEELERGGLVHSIFGI